MAQQTRRDFLRTTGAAAAVIAFAPLRGPVSAPPPPGSWNHDPASPIGPLHWGDIGFPACGASLTQSPVDIRTGAVVTERGAPLRLTYRSSELAVENTGHVIEVPIPAGVQNTLVLDGDAYTLSQFHFHAPSEHVVNGRAADVEAHLVHANAAGATAVVGVFFHVGAKPNPLVDSILLAAPEAVGEEVTVGEASPAELFRHLRGVEPEHGRLQVSSFYAYDGSLTTPGCGEGVRWSVLADGGGVSKATVTRAHEVIARFPYYGGYPDNNRPVQPLNGRVIKQRRGCH